MDSRIVEIAAWSRPVDGFPADFGERRAGREPLDQVGIGDVGSSSANLSLKLLHSEVPIFPGCSMIACHRIPIQSLSLFASITTTSRSLLPSATAALPCKAAKK